MSQRKILFQLSGSIAAFKACSLISKLVQEGFDVQTVCTQGALQFVGPATLAGLTGKPVLSDTFAPGHAMDHIHLARGADLILLCPATASSINKLASGIGDDIVGTLFLAHENRARYWIVPAMNPAMYAHPATQESLRKLRHWGVQILEPDTGPTACGETGVGRMLEPEKILQKIEAFFASPSAQTGTKPPRQRVLVTSGATREPIDAVRFLTNFSTGATGAAIADVFSEAGNEVLYLHGTGALRPSAPCEAVEFGDVRDLDRKLKVLLHEKRFDLVIHAAAVSDFSVSRIEGAGGTVYPASSDGAKLPSSGEIRLELAPTPKLLDTIRSRSRNPAVKLVAFKLTHGADGVAEVKRLLAHSSADYVVHNDLSRVGSSTHRTTIYDSTACAIAACESKRALAEELLAIALPANGTTTKIQAHRRNSDQEKELNL